MVSQVITATVVGIDSYKILVEVDLVQSIPSVVIVGLPDTAVSEAKERVRTAIKNSGFVFPNQKVIINLAPADIKKEGTNYDLPIAIGILARDGIVDEEKIKDTIIQTMVSFIENYDFFVKELETDDYFYGLEDSKDE